ncbi:MAG: hypothetical protein MJ153_07790 [Clostridia bacterium]|nr:hypothetical protein [Clostridia bacterium]
MISVKCSNCASELAIDTHGNLICPYCGSKSFMSDKELSEYKNLRMNMLNYLRTENDLRGNRTGDNTIWSHNELLSLRASNGDIVNIRYTFYSEYDGVKTYITEDSVVNIFEKEDEAKATAVPGNIKLLCYPSAAGKDLSKYFPHIKVNLKLFDGRTLLAYSKPGNCYPLFAFGNLRPKHVAWIVSRMENFCCVFEYSSIIHGGISTDTVFINPTTHEAYLLGGWWKARQKHSFAKNEDLTALRLTADRLMGEFKAEAPHEFKDFIKSKPAEDAYTDFGNWDKVIVNGFGGHNFTKFKEG